ncbi:MAG: stage II sporulation protein P, partial [Eubacterium sp.]|nr:stage II sporulation protein P [Eubacterium sp.]
KKDISILAVNIVAMLCVVVMIINLAPHITTQIGIFNQSVVSVFSPQKFISDFTDISNNNEEETEDNNNTAAEVMKPSTGIKGKDSDLYSDITKTPDDIAKLMSDAEKTIEEETVKGKTSEEDYFGGGTLVAFDKVEIQSKIPDSFYNPNIEELLNQKADLSIQDISQPTVLVYHTHTTESYTLLDVGYYTESFDLRSKDNDKNMVRVGDELVDYLEKMGIGVIHDTEIHDESYNGAYASSRASVEEYLEKYPTIEVTIDVHRDDITYQNDTKVKPTAVINGKKAARMMIIAGAQYGSIENYPDWEYNLRFALAVQNKVCEMYDGLMRPILFSERKYNMDETKNSFLLEVGTDANTLDEACYAARLFATSLGELLKEEYCEN